jgi:hypothetical protein
MSHDQKPARVRVVNAARSPTAAGGKAGGGTGSVGASAGAAEGDAGANAAATGAKPAGGARASLLVGGLFLVAAAIGGACVALFLP